MATQCCRPAAPSSTTVVDNCAHSTPAAVTECLETTYSSVDRGPPTVIILDDLHHVGSPALLADAFNVLLGLPLHEWLDCSLT